MKMLEPLLFAFTLVALPALAWLAGRAMGRRDWPIARVLVAGCFVAAIPYAARIAFAALAAGTPYWAALHVQASASLDYPEVGMFFVTLAVFVTMLGWTSTPVKPARAAAASDTEAP